MNTKKNKVQHNTRQRGRQEAGKQLKSRKTNRNKLLQRSMGHYYFLLVLTSGPSTIFFLRVVLGRDRTLVTTV